MARESKKAPAPRTLEEVKKIAADIHANLIFTSSMVPERDQNLLPVIFLPTALFDKKQHREFVAKCKDGSIQVLFEYYSKAMQRSINGYPTFGSFSTLSKQEVAQVDHFLKRLQKAKEIALS